MAFSLFGWGTLTPRCTSTTRARRTRISPNEGYLTRDFRQDAYTLLNLRLIYEPNDMWQSSRSSATNVTDIDYFTSSVDLTNTLGVGAVTTKQPRFVGGEVRFHWDSPAFMNF